MNKMAQIQTPSEIHWWAAPRILQGKYTNDNRTTESCECGACNNKKRYLQRRSASNHNGTLEIPPIVHEVLNSPGQPLDADTRAVIEPRFGHDFSKVRVHTDSKANLAADAIDANAFTYGQHIAFGTGFFAPRTAEGHALLAHELTHTVQQLNSANDLSPARIALTDDPSERAAEAAEHSISLGSRGKIPTPTATIQCQRRRGRPRTATPAIPPERLIHAEDVAGILSEQLQFWYLGSRFGIQNARLGEDDSTKWFLIALGGNLIWAATALINPAATLAVRVMSVGGAVIGSGTAQRLFEENRPINDLRENAVNNLSATYRNMTDQRADLVAQLTDHFRQLGLVDRDNAIQTEQRRQAMWRHIFRTDITYNDPGKLEENARRDIEMTWRDFEPCHTVYVHGLLTPDYIRNDIPRYELTCFYRALVRSGVADRALGVERSIVYGVSGSDDTIELTEEEVHYEFPGGATATQTPRPHSFWWGNVTANIP